MLEVASELVDQPEWRYRQARVGLREQGGDGWPIALFGSDSPAVIAQGSATGHVLFLAAPTASTSLTQALYERDRRAEVGNFFYLYRSNHFGAFCALSR